MLISKSDFRAIIIVINTVAAIAFLVITNGVLQSHPSALWFIFGGLSVIVLAALIYGAYRLIKYIREMP